ncbi:hypothetical protein H920_08113 [Fukomys damarensis]|uniref:Uncharacterized protein n=1 Tax=Fukomys damarensis TaxID=885580 RepID=A0A091E5U5_FUKDA|nr:hypothetical protein H920_08113 [Fukomys damarensis]
MGRQDYRWNYNTQDAPKSHAPKKEEQRELAAMLGAPGWLHGAAGPVWITGVEKSLSKDAEGKNLLFIIIPQSSGNQGCLQLMESCPGASRNQGTVEASTVIGGTLSAYHSQLTARH